MFSVYVITSPERIKEESKKIELLFESGVEGIHIRKPSWTLSEIKSLIEDIPYKFRKKLRLHGHFELLNEMNLAGVHLNSRNPTAPQNALSVSLTCHSITEIPNSSKYSYVTLSPIFNSISKPDYKSGFNLDSIEKSIQGKNVIALGGVTPDKFLLLKSKGFSGAALLGYIWEGDFNKNLKSLEIAIKEINRKDKN